MPTNSTRNPPRPFRLSERSAWAGDRRFFAYSASSPGTESQTLLILCGRDGGASCEHWVVIDGEFDVGEFERPASALEERFGRLVSGGLGLSASEGGASLRAAFAGEWGLHVGLRGRRVTTPQNGNGRWSISATGLGDLRDVISCLRGLGEAVERVLGDFEEPGVQIFQPGGHGGEALAGLVAALAAMDDDGARNVSAVLSLLSASKDTENVACERCGHDFTRRSSERWKNVCRSCFSRPSMEAEKGVVDMPEVAAKVPAVDDRRVVTECMLIERIDAFLLPHGLKLRKGILVPFVAVRISDGSIVRSKIMDLEALGRGFKVLKPNEVLAPVAAPRRTQSV